MQTAEPIAKALKLSAIVWNEIYEVGGVYENGEGRRGLTRAEMKGMFPTYTIPEDQVAEDGWYDVSLNKEPRPAGRERANGVFDKLKKQAMEATSDRTIVLVVHGDFIDFLLQSAVGVEGTSRFFPCFNTCISVLDMTAKDTMILFHNSIAHLSEDLVKTHALGKC
eukprot:CAMPEP_0118685422 /NCGR_PEP_ID=MMETSP0800-20121206/7233_1 /TAXON_ID=210618 ORGANISM="Striatella unipunctata, Strain CCMP2910" /NCGR_SAMPLE_ID=MMETSP0800 /ASSEMBLY_ACC=CAM_ASM_000638 /LENGTH=165 /DNA_ID=CAMNT_0006582323 /DNA_START=173 /DNA_END=670 /DNA_ORIENTATION=-